jgi:hypothetical protein
MSRTSIRDLPNEVLNQILSSVVNDHHARVEFHDGHRWHSLPQALILSSVCRQFRMVVFELPFWYQNEFEFRNLIDPNTGNGQQTALENAEFKLIQELLENEQLVSRFALKTEWRFFHPINYNRVELYLPTFRKKTKKITFSSIGDCKPGDWSRLVVESLQRCINITSLTIDSCAQIGVLEEVLEACPLLEELQLLEYPLDSSLQQAKDSLLHLRRLHVMQTTNWEELQFTDTFKLPVQSAGVLTDFSFHFEYVAYDYTWEDIYSIGEELSLFSKLTALKLCPLVIETCQVITTTFFPLTRLHFYYSNFFDTISEQTFVEMFSSPSLRSLSFLSMHFKYADSWEELELNGENILLAVTQNLRLLEEFELSFALNIDWLYLFANLKMLKRIEWDVFWEDVEQNSAFPHFHAYSCLNSKPIKRTIESVFRSKYPSTNETPGLDVTIRGPRPWYWDDGFAYDGCMDYSSDGSITQFDE